MSLGRRDFDNPGGILWHHWNNFHVSRLNMNVTTVILDIIGGDLRCPPSKLIVPDSDSINGSSRICRKSDEARSWEWCEQNVSFAGGHLNELSTYFVALNLRS